MGESEDVDQKGSLFIVDPNPPGRDMIPPEDMFIYVKFTASPRSRNTYGGTDPKTNKNTFFTSGTDEVDFISTKIRYNPDGILGDNQKTYATTSWTNIGGLGPTESRGVLEGFGIKSIDIKYNASLVPVVDITFTDIRGAGLFDTIKDKERLSPYSVFFKMPYPVFNLSVKGYFGQSVDYCLHMVNWTSDFDGTTGNFDIKANFLGFQQAFLNDMNIGNIIGTVNTAKGLQNLNDIFDEQDANIEKLSSSLGVADALSINEKEKDNSVRKIDDFFTKIAKLQIETEVLKSGTDKLDKLKGINGMLSLLKSIRTFIGSPIPKSHDFDNSGNIDEFEKSTISSFKKLDKGGKSDFDSGIYLMEKNNKRIIKGSKIKDDTLEADKNYLSIRDYLLINSIQQAAFKTYINTLNDLITTYTDYTTNLFKNTSTGVEDNNQQLIDSFNFGPDKEANWKNFIRNDQQKPEKLHLVLDNMVDPKNTLYLQDNWLGSENMYFDIKSFSDIKNSSDGFYKKTKGLTKDTNILIADFREQRSRVQALIQELELEAKEERKEVQATLNDEILANFENELGFKPTIASCFRIISNNTQAMTSTIYDISNEASQPNKKEERAEALFGFQTDIPLDIKDPVAWPLVYSDNDNGTQEEFYLGDNIHIPIEVANQSFPEVKFVEEVFLNLIAKTKSLDQISKAAALKGGLDTDNWYPINPIDYNINPWIECTVLNDTPEMDDFIVKSIFSRVAVLTNYSRWTGTARELSKYAGLDGIAANTTFFSADIRNIYKNKLLEMGQNPHLSFKTTKFYKENLTTNGNGDLEWDSRSPLNFGGNYIGGTSTKYTGDDPVNIDYILFDGYNGKDWPGIIHNTKKLPSDVTQNTRFTAIKDIKNGPEDFYKETYISNNIVTKIAYNVWDEKVSKKLNGKANNEYSQFSIDNLITDIDLSGTTADDKLGTFLNRTNFQDVTTTTTSILGVVTTNTCSAPQFLIQNDFYTKQNSVYAKALLLLSTLPFKTFKEAVLDVAFPNGLYNNAKIINLPEYYIYFIGAYLWKSQNENLIKWDINFSDSSICSYTEFFTPDGCYLSKVGYLATTNPKGSIPIEPELLNMPSNTKNLFINKFTKWADSSEFGEDSSTGFEYDMKTYRGPTTSQEDMATSASDIKTVLLPTVNMIVLAPAIFDKNNPLPKRLTASPADIKTYVDNFLTTYENIDAGRVESSQDDSESEVSANKTTNKIKLQIYNYFKNINDKWVSDTKKCFNVCGSGTEEQSLFDYFKFVDRGWNNIGDKATINLSSFLTLGSNLQTSVYFFMAKLLRDSNFLFQILPTYINFTDPAEISKMFKPTTTLQGNSSSGPIYCCIYVGGASQALDIGEKSEYQFANDGFSIDNAGADMTDPGGNTLVAFRVGFGAENQTIFKNVSLSQQEHKETGEYFKALSELVDKRGGTQKVYQGTDLLRLFKTRSYTCKVDALGCMNIQPLMYFNLENVPFFNGAYLITSVNHSISPNHMTTNFQGVRQSKYISKPNEEILADLNIDLNETNKLPKFEFTNLSATSPIYKIGVSAPTGKFNFTDNWKKSNFEEMGVVFEAGIDAQVELDKVKVHVEKSGIINNSQVCMFVANIMSQSNYLTNKEISWKVSSNVERVTFDDSTIYSGKTRSYGINPPTDGPFKDEFSNAAGTISGSTPTFTGTVDTNFAFKSKDSTPYEKDVDQYNQLLVEKQSAIFNGNKNSDETGYLTPTQVKDTIRAIDKQILSGLTYFNIYPGDGFRFKPRGYLYITGRREYYNYTKKGTEGVATTNNYLNDPEKVSSNFEESFKAAIYVWKNKPPSNKEVLKEYKSAYEVAGVVKPNTPPPSPPLLVPTKIKEPTGSAMDYASTTDIATGIKDPEQAFNAFESVLLAFNLKDDDNP